MEWNKILAVLTSRGNKTAVWAEIGVMWTVLFLF